MKYETELMLFKTALLLLLSPYQFIFSLFSVKHSDTYSSAGLSLLYMDYELSYTVIAYLDTFYPSSVFSQARNLFLCGPSHS